MQLQSGAADGIDNVGTDDFDTVKSDGNLQLVERPALNVFYVGFNVDNPPFDNEKVRQAIGYAIDKQRIVDNFYPKGSTVATQFLPAAIPGYAKGFTDFTYDQAKAKELLQESGVADRLNVTLSYRDVARGYLAQPAAGGPGHPGPAGRGRHQRHAGPAGVDDVHRQRQRRQAALLPARLGRRLSRTPRTSSTTTSVPAARRSSARASPTSRP